MLSALWYKWFSRISSACVLPLMWQITFYLPPYKVQTATFFCILIFPLLGSRKEKKKDSNRMVENNPRTYSFLNETFLTSIPNHSIVHTNTCTLSLVKIYLKHLKKLLHVSVYDHHQGVTMSLPKSLLFNHSCMYAKRGGVAACHIVWIGLCLRSVPGSFN